MAERFNPMYLEGRPPWDIGRPQSVFVQLVEDGEISGSILDVGCGTGENALYLAGRGFTVTGVDAAPAAIEQARLKAIQRGVDITFAVGDVLDLSAHDDAFDSAIDSGCFHVFDDAERKRYVASVGGAIRTGGRLFLCCFSDRQPGTWGPRRMTQDELRAAFARGWHVDWIRAANFDVTPTIPELTAQEPGGDPRIAAWLMRASRV